MTRDAEQERHDRRMMLMRMQGETNRIETRNHIMMVFAIVLGIIAIIFSLV
jgi:hypothetical protein